MVCLPTLQGNDLLIFCGDKGGTKGLCECQVSTLSLSYTSICLLFKMESQCAVTQATFRLIGSNGPSASASPVVTTTGMCHHPSPK